MLTEELKLVVLVLKVSNVAITAKPLDHTQQYKTRILTPFQQGKDNWNHRLSSGQHWHKPRPYEKHTPEWHADTRDGVEHAETTDGLFPAGLPQGQLSLAHPRETGSSESVVLSQPDGTAVLGTAVSRRIVNWPLLTDIPHSYPLVARGGDEHISACVP